VIATISTNSFSIKEMSLQALQQNLAKLQPNPGATIHAVLQPNPSIHRSQQLQTLAFIDYNSYKP
jgi:hypothetical protein